MRILTEEFQKAIEITSLAAGKDMSPIHNVIQIEGKEDRITFTSKSRDSTFHYDILLDNNEIDCMCIELKTVLALSKAITSKYTNIVFHEDYLEIKSNGKAKFNAIVDSLNKKIRLLDERFDFESDTLDNNFNHLFNLSSKFVSETVAPYTKVYFGENIIASDCSFAMRYNEKIFSEAVLLRPDILKVLSKLDDELQYTFIIDRKQDSILQKLLIKDSKSYYEIIRSGDVAQYQNYSIDELLDRDYDNSITIDSNELKQALKRYKATEFLPTIKIIFNNEGIRLLSQRYDELISSESNSSEVEITFEFDRFNKYVSMLQNDTVVISYVDDKMIKIDDEKTEFLLSCSL